MSFWAKLSQGLALIGAIMAHALSLEVVGGSVDLPATFLQIQERKFEISVKIKRTA